MSVTDGRTARAQRTRAAIVEACIALVDEGDLRPTAPRVAEQAGVSVRSVFQHFDDLEALFAAMADRLVERLGHLVTTIDAGAPLEERVAALVRQRVLLLEAVTPIRRAAAVQAPFSAEIRQRLQSGHDFLRDEVARVFAPEIGTRTAVLDLLDTLLSWPSWETLRTMEGRSVDEARRVLEQGVHAVLA